MVQLSHPYMTTGKTIALTIWTFVSKVMSLLFNMISRFVIAFSKEVKVLVTHLCLALCDPMDCPWDSPGKNTGVGCHSLLQGIFPTQGLNLCLLHCRKSLYHLSHQVSPMVIISQNLQISNHYVVHLKLIQNYMSFISQ